MEKRRLDPRVRFQHAKFTRKLSEARHYKRNAKARPDSRLEAGLEKVGLASLLAQLLVAAGLIIVVYLFYVPNPFFIQKIRIEGLSPENINLAQEAVKSYQNSKPWYVPVNSIFFFNTNSIAKVVAQKVPAISKVVSAGKSIKTKTATIKVIEKYERYTIVRPEDELILFNDGTVKTQLPVNKLADLPQSGALVTISVNNTQPVNSGDIYLDPPLLLLIEQSATLFPQQTAENLAYFEVKLPASDPNINNKFTDSWKQSSIIAVVTKKAGTGKSNPAQLKIILEPDLDIAMAADRLKLLLDQTAPDRYRSLYYVDMRLSNRAYLCLINTPCATTNP